ncbi:MAG TPA: ABC transporter ATP-binding protein, partial [Hyphomonas sp.]|nr:ABC transporter ATP-binding protein [Hyphomonas sp.]HBX97745.1 ABC transporter ATP-binding protein [Hyphomonas sp.]
MVEGVSLTLEPGNITALLGGSGAGKSTLLRLFAGLEPLDGGEIRLGDELLSAPGKTVPAEKRR